MVKETMFLYYLSYHTIDKLNEYKTLQPKTIPEWIKLNCIIVKIMIFNPIRHMSIHKFQKLYHPFYNMYLSQNYHLL